MQPTAAMEHSEIHLLWASGIADRALGVIVGPVAAPLFHFALHIAENKEELRESVICF